MKKLSKEERRGAVTIAALVTIILGTAFFIRTCDHNRRPDEGQVTIIYRDTVSDNGRTEIHRKKEKKDSTKSKRKRGKPKKNSKELNKSGQRDFLSDTIRVRRSISQ